MTHSETFIDGVLNVALVRGLVRIDLYSLSATEVAPDGSAKPEFRERLVLHPNVLPDLLRTLQLAVAALRERGLLQGPAPDADADAAPARPPIAVDNEASAVLAGTPPEQGEGASADRRPRSRNFPSTLS